jgi:putative addiction module component (TIGR02574 family)
MSNRHGGIRMNPTFEEVVVQAERLSEAERVALIDRLLKSLDGPPDADVEAAWQREIERRIEAVDRGEMRSIPWQEARQRLGL